MDFVFRKRVARSALLLGLLGFSSCGPGEPERPGAGSQAGSVEEGPVLGEDAQAMSLLGEPLVAPTLPPEVKEARERDLEEALSRLSEDPENADALIWAGRRYAYLGEYQQAIQVFSLGIDFHPEDARFYRHRGHRYITVRQFDLALADFRRAAELIEGTDDEVEPDGQPNAAGIPTSTLHFNVWYHYGLAHYLKGEFEEAAAIYRRCMDASVHADSKVATAHWWYMTLKRLGRDREAEALVNGMPLDRLEGEIIESGSYLALLRGYSAGGTGEDAFSFSLDPESLEGATLGYGVGNYFFYNGNPERAEAVFRGIVEARDQWAAFGYIAAEADLARMEGK